MMKLALTTLSVLALMATGLRTPSAMGSDGSAPSPVSFVDKSPVFAGDQALKNPNLPSLHAGTIVGQGGLCLTASSLGPKTTSGNAQAFMEVCNLDSTSNQRWTRMLSTGQIIHQGSDKCLNIEGGASGTTVIVYACSDAKAVSSNEAWAYVPLQDGRVQIKNTGLPGASEKCLNVYQALRSRETGTIVWPCQPGGAMNDLWFPEPQPIVVPIKFYRLADDDGTAEAPVSVSDMTYIIGLVNSLYRRAGVVFEVSTALWTTHRGSSLNTGRSAAVPGWATVTDSELNALGQAGAKVDAELRNMVDTTRLTVFLPNAGGGYSGLSSDPKKRPRDYAKMPGIVVGDVGIGPVNTGKRGYAKLMAHELGHYFGLSHTFVEPPKWNEGDAPYPKFGADFARTQLVAAKGNAEAAFDGDNLPGTFPDPGPWVFEERSGGSWQSCEGSSTITIGVSPGSSLTVDRSNIMSYFFCEAIPYISPNRLTDMLSPHQLATIRSVLLSRTHLAVKK